MCLERWGVDHLAEVHLLMRDVDISRVSPSVLWSTWYPQVLEVWGAIIRNPSRHHQDEVGKRLERRGSLKGRAASTSPGYRGKSWRLVTGWQRANEEIVPSALSLSPAGMWMWMFFRFELTNFCHFQNGKSVKMSVKCMEKFEDLTERWLHSIQKKSDLPGSKTASVSVTVLRFQSWSLWPRKTSKHCRRCDL